MSFDKPASSATRLGQNQFHSLQEFYRRYHHLPARHSAARRVVGAVFPLLRRPGVIEDQIDAPLGLMCCFAPIYKSGRATTKALGVGRFDAQGRAHRKILLTDGRRVEYVAICPPGVNPPDEKMPPIIVQPQPHREAAFPAVGHPICATPKHFKRLAYRRSVAVTSKSGLVTTAGIGLGSGVEDTSKAGCFCGLEVEY
jgi:hypothetical protein